MLSPAEASHRRETLLLRYYRRQTRQVRPPETRRERARARAADDEVRPLGGKPLGEIGYRNFHGARDARGKRVAKRGLVAFAHRVSRDDGARRRQREIHGGPSRSRDLRKRVARFRRNRRPSPFRRAR